MLGFWSGSKICVISLFVLQEILWYKQFHSLKVSLSCSWKKSILEMLAFHRAVTICSFIHSYSLFTIHSFIEHAGATGTTMADMYQSGFVWSKVVGTELSLKTEIIDRHIYYYCIQVLYLSASWYIISEHQPILYWNLAQMHETCTIVANQWTMGV